MNAKLLFPSNFKIFGFILFIPSLILLLIEYVYSLNFDSYLSLRVFAIYAERIGNNAKFFEIIEDKFMYELVFIGLILGGILINFSKLKNEDEYTMQIRYESLVWATYFNYGALLFFIIFIYGLPFINVVLLNLYSLLIFFMVRFHYKIFLLNKSSKDEK